MHLEITVSLLSFSEEQAEASIREYIVPIPRRTGQQNGQFRLAVTGQLWYEEDSVTSSGMLSGPPPLSPRNHT